MNEWRIPLKGVMRGWYPSLELLSSRTIQGVLREGVVLADEVFCVGNFYLCFKCFLFMSVLVVVE